MVVKVIKAFIVLTLVHPMPALAASQLVLKVDNDILGGGSDGHYTNGFEVGEFFQLESDHWLRAAASAVPGWSTGDTTIGAYRLGQQIYTPEDIERARAQPADRPYAGLLYVGFSVFQQRNRKGWRETGELAADVGMVGPASGAEKVQRAVHDLTNSSEPRGWDHQLSNKPFVNVGYQQRRWWQAQLGSIEMEYGPSASLMAGTIYTYAGSGVGLRFGQGLQRSSGLPSVSPSLGGNQYIQSGGDTAWYGFFDLQGRYMARNQLLDRSDSEVSINRSNWVGDAQAGVAVMVQTWEVAFSCVWRTREFREQNQHDQFGSISVSSQF